MMDVVSVFCGRDLALQRLQAQSLARFFERSRLGRVIYIWNDTAEMPGSLRYELAASLDGIDLELLPAGELGVEPAAIAADGWTTQQALKLLAARRTNAACYLVLDAKNHFVWPCSVSDFMTADGRGIAPLEDIGRSESFRYCLDYFGVHRETDTCHGALNVTPFLLTTALVERMLALLEHEDGRTTAQTFLAHQHRLTEFMAYQAYALAEGVALADLYHDAEAPIAETVWGSIVRSPGEFERCMQRLESGRTKVLGLHWMACCLLSPKQQARLCEFWTRRGLMASAAAGRRAIASVTGSLRAGDREFLRRSLN